MFLRTETPRLQETGQAYSEVGWEAVWINPGWVGASGKRARAEAHLDEHIWMSQGLWEERISSSGGLHWSMQFVLLSGDLGSSSSPEPFLNFSSSSGQGSLNVRDAKAGGLSQCGLSKQDNQSSRAEGRHPQCTGALCSPTVQTRLEPLSHIRPSFQDVCFVRAPEVSSNA